MIQKKNAIIMIILVILSLFMMIIPNYSYATSPIENPGYYDPSQSEIDVGQDSIKKTANIIIGVIKTIGIMLSVLILVVLGIKYMLGSLEEKAEYKKTMIPYLIGAVMIFAIPQLVQIIYDIVNSTLN